MISLTNDQEPLLVITLHPQVIAAEGEKKASGALREASEIISESPAALQLRYLQVSGKDPILPVKKLFWWMISDNTSHQRANVFLSLSPRQTINLKP